MRFVLEKNLLEQMQVRALYRPEIQFYISKYDQSPFSRTLHKKKLDE